MEEGFALAQTLQQALNISPQGSNLPSDYRDFYEKT
jgi:hypothetical protein